MAVSITIRSVPDDVRDELARRASLAGQSLQEFLSAELRSLAERPSPAEALSRARRIARLNTPVSAEEIICDLESERR